MRHKQRSVATTFVDKDGDGEKCVKLGKLHFRVSYNYNRQALCVTVVKCSELPPKESASASMDPYVKLSLLPDKEHRVSKNSAQYS